MDSPLDYPRWVVQRRVLARSVDPPERWAAHLRLPTVALVGAHDPVGWAARTHAARHAEIAELFARAELAHAHRLRITSTRQAAVWLLSLNQ